jgi:hypothetical protein
LLVLISLACGGWRWTAVVTFFVDFDLIDIVDVLILI